MIQTLTLKNFRNFQDKTFENFDLKNFIVGANGKGKTNSLEAIALLGNNSIIHLPLEDLVKNGEGYFFIEAQYQDSKKISLFYEKESKKKKYSINGKKVTKKQFAEQSFQVVHFSPILMNMLYLGPSLRRDFLDRILISSFPGFDAIKKEYHKVIKTRNATLKAIRDNEISIENLGFWNEKCIEIAHKYYKKRFLLIEFFSKHIQKINKFVNIPCEKIDFCYETKVQKESIVDDMRNYFTQNQQRDIILARTPIGPHIDDFSIKINAQEITHFASRGEIKSIIIYLKLLEGIFIETTTKKKPLLLIDDLLSELDTYHKSTLLENISYYQTFISNIENNGENGNILEL